MDFVNPLEKYEKIFGYEFTPSHNPVKDTYSLSYSAEGVWVISVRKFALKI